MMMQAGDQAPPAPAVSVIMPTYNDGEMLREAIESVLKQSFRDLELIIVDDASRVDPAPLIRAFSDQRLRYLRLEQNQGAAKSRNRGLELAVGRYIAFIDGDDLWRSDKLEKQIAFMQGHECGFVYSRFLLIDVNGTVFGHSEKMPARATYKRLLRHCFIRTSSLIFDTRKVGGKHWFPELRRRQDYGLFLSLLKIADGHLVDDYLCSYRIRPGSISSGKLGNIPYQWAIYREVEGFGRVRALSYLAQWFMRAGLVVLRRKLLAAARFAGGFLRRTPSLSGR